MSLTLIEKIWNDHVIKDDGDGNFLIYIDRIFLHERTGSIALKSIEESNRSVRNPKKVFSTIDHIVDTFPGRNDTTLMPSGSAFIKSFRDSVNKEGINFFDLDNEHQGISHVVSPEQGIALPGITYICPDSHTCSLGGLGSMAWGVGSSECEHALVTNTLLLKKPKMMQVTFEGKLAEGVSSKDLILYLISKYGAAGGKGYAIEFKGPVINKLGIEARLTLCNMAVEFGAWTGIIAPDQKIFDYLKDKPFAPKKEKYNEALDQWNKLYSDPDAHFDKQLTINCSNLSPFVTWGTSPEQALQINDVIPEPHNIQNALEKESALRAMEYMNLEAHQKINTIKIDAAFIGSCTNSRISDLRSAAKLLKGKKVAKGVKAICVPGSTQVKKMAEQEGLDKIFIEAGFEWREAGCSMCFFVGGESFEEKSRVITTTNRNFENRQGKGTRSHLASPTTVAASAISGHINFTKNIGSEV